jgi:hypothetical protein
VTSTIKNITKLLAASVSKKNCTKLSNHSTCENLSTLVTLLKLERDFRGNSCRPRRPRRDRTALPGKLISSFIK